MYCLFSAHILKQKQKTTKSLFVHVRTKHSNSNAQRTSNVKDGERVENIEVCSSEGEGEDDESMGWSSDSSEGRESAEKDSGVCEFGGLNEKDKVMFQLVGEESMREGVIVEKDRMQRRLRILEKGKRSKGAWHSYDTVFKSLDIVVC